MAAIKPVVTVEDHLLDAGSGAWLRNRLPPLDSTLRLPIIDLRKASHVA